MVEEKETVRWLSTLVNRVEQYLEREEQLRELFTSLLGKLNEGLERIRSEIRYQTETVEECHQNDELLVSNSKELLEIQKEFLAIRKFEVAWDKIKELVAGKEETTTDDRRQWVETECPDTEVVEKPDESPHNEGDD